MNEAFFEYSCYVFWYVKGVPQPGVYSELFTFYLDSGKGWQFTYYGC
jgi:hypothetical protein